MSLIPTGDNCTFLETFMTPQCQFCTKMSDLCYLRKPRLSVLIYCFVTILESQPPSNNCCTCSTYDILEKTLSHNKDWERHKI